MYNGEYRGRGFRFGWLPFFLGFLFLMMLFTRGFHFLWFFVWPLVFLLPFALAVGVAIMIAKHWRYNGQYMYKRKNDFYYGSKPKREDDSDSEIFYV